MKNVKLEWEEAMEIADILTQADNPDEEFGVTEKALFDKWGIDCDIFHEIANGIFQMTDFGISPLTQTPFVGISKGYEWLAKKEVNQQFIFSLIQWCTEGKDIPEGKKGFKRTITKGGKPEFDIIISKPKPSDSGIKSEANENETKKTKN